LLIPQGLLAKLLKETGEGLLNLKDLLTLFPPSRKRLFESEPVLRPSFLCRIAPNSAIFRQNVAEYGRKSVCFATDFSRKYQSCGSVKL